VAAPISNRGRKSDKSWRDALRRALARAGKSDGVDGGLNAVADTVVALAMSGDKDAYKEIGDRLDGKPHQSVEINETSTRYVINADSAPTRDEWKAKHTPTLTTLQ